MARAAADVPSAQIELSGRGIVTLRGRLAITGSVTVRGTITLIDRAADAVVHVDGVPVTFNRKGRATVRRVQGVLYATGSDVTVQINSRGLSLSAAGTGTARLTGSGRYRLNMGVERAWPRTTVRLVPTPLASPARAAR